MDRETPNIKVQRLSEMRNIQFSFFPMNGASDKLYYCSPKSSVLSCRGLYIHALVN